jgi:hypothetical protein
LWPAGAAPHRLILKPSTDQVIKDTDAADAKYCGGAMTGGTGWMCW